MMLFIWYVAVWQGIFEQMLSGQMYELQPVPSARLKR
jgi:hypothetical protein